MDKDQKIKKAIANLKVAKLRVLAANQRSAAAAHIRQAKQPIYPGQAEICLDKAATINAYADRTLAQADLIEAED